MISLLDSSSANNVAANAAGATLTPDPFDVAALRLSGNFLAASGVKKIILSIPVRKPDRSWFVRVHPDPAFTFDTAVIEMKEDREVFLVARDLWPELASEATFIPITLFTAISRTGVSFLWPVRLAGSDGKSMGWWDTAREAVTIAQGKWCCVVANLQLGGYEVFVANGELAEPLWPEMTFQQILRVAFKDRYIDSADHVVLRKLRGDV